MSHERDVFLYKHDAASWGLQSTPKVESGQERLSGTSRWGCWRSLVVIADHFMYTTNLLMLPSKVYFHLPTSKSP